MTIRTTRVYPVPGRVIRHPETGELVPAEGIDVPRAGYWLRRLLDGDLSEKKPAKPVAGELRANLAIPEEQPAGTEIAQKSNLRSSGRNTQPSREA